MESLNSNLQERELHQLQLMQHKAKESCMKSFRLLQSHLQVLSYNELKINECLECTFKTLFQQDVQTFTGSMLLHLDQLEKQLGNEEFQETRSIDAFKALKRQFQLLISYQYNFEEFHELMLRKYFLAYTQTEVQQFRNSLIQHMESVKKSIDERAQCQREYDCRMNDRQMQSKKKMKLLIQKVQSNTVYELKVDSVVIENTCSRKENGTSVTASSKKIKESSLDFATKYVHAIRYKMSNSKERELQHTQVLIKQRQSNCMAWFEQLEIHLHALYCNTPKIREGGGGKAGGGKGSGASRLTDSIIFIKRESTGERSKEGQRKAGGGDEQKGAEETGHGRKGKEKRGEKGVWARAHASGPGRMMGVPPRAAQGRGESGRDGSVRQGEEATIYMWGTNGKEKTEEERGEIYESITQAIVIKGESMLGKRSVKRKMEDAGRGTVGSRTGEKIRKSGECEGETQILSMAGKGGEREEERSGGKRGKQVEEKGSEADSGEEWRGHDDVCHHCKEVGHWKRNCPVYLAELQKKRKQVGSASSSGIFTIELFSFPNNNSWVYDTGCGTNICITKQGFRIERKLKQGALYLYVGNGVRAQVEAIGSFDLVLPNGLVICLDNCHYAPTITRGVVSVSCLVDNGFVQCFTDYGISVSKNGVLYFNVVPRNGIYEIDMHDLVPNVNSIYNVSNKRVKHNLDSTYLWHCRLAHINKKRIKQLQQDGLLKSTDDESFDKCESCLSGKMTKKPFPHSNERAKDLLGIIAYDVCGPLRHVSRQGASYFITFTDDYSRYGYVYLLKHKHEVFETFKVFKNKVENQLGKTIKAIRSDRGGEYISQEFKDYLKANGIVQQLTPPYTPQHNGVSERRNRTLLDMVRSMMNLTTLPLSFWDYALESATRILNMVPTKKALMKRDTPDKLEQRSVKCIFIGYPKETMGYYFYFPPENKIVVARYAEFFEKRLISQEISGRAVDLEEIQEEEDTTPSEITSNIPQEVEGFEPPQEEVIPIRRSERTHRAPNRLCLNVEVEEHSLGDLNEPTGYKPQSIMYAVRCTRPDVAFAQNMTSRFQQNPGEPHWTAVKNILKYLRNTKDMFLVYGGNPSTELRVECYCDVDSRLIEMITKSQTGYVFILNGGAVDWKSSKQSTTAMSATESEYIAASEAAMEAVWIRKFISGLGIVPTINEPLNMYCDNSAAVHYANEPGVQKGARHYHRRYHYVRECVELGEIKILKVHTDNNLADPFTKALSNRKLTQHARGMGLRPASSFM
ncbi:retrotransposon protein, putative, ty1-copia subclass [Tanacetum coccineum]